MDSEDIADCVKVLVVGSFCLFLALLVLLGVYRSGYRQGQIDYANKNIQYELKTNDEGETVWQRVSKAEKSE